MTSSTRSTGSHAGRAVPLAEPRHAGLWAALTYAVCTLLLAWPALGGGFLVNAHSDQYIGGFPVRDFAGQALKAGQGIPQWNPYLFGGMPYIGAMHGDIFYPTALLRVLLQTDVGMTWGFIDRLRETVKVKLVLKGIMTGEDAAEALRHGVDGIIVSNHGGRAEASNQSTLGVLPEVVKAVNGKVPVLVDGGVRRGTDVFKALALGATAVGIGRPYCWGLAAFGQAGVDRVLALVQDEFVIIMRQAGTLDLSAINAKYLTPATRPVHALGTESGRKYDLAD